MTYTKDQLINKLSIENGRLRFLMNEAITLMIHAETFICTREKMHPTGRQQWSDLVDRMQEVIAEP